MGVLTLENSSKGCLSGNRCQAVHACILHAFILVSTHAEHCVSLSGGIEKCSASLLSSKNLESV